MKKRLWLIIGLEGIALLSAAALIFLLSNRTIDPEPQKESSKPVLSTEHVDTSPPDTGQTLPEDTSVSIPTTEATIPGETTEPVTEPYIPPATTRPPETEPPTEPPKPKVLQYNRFGRYSGAYVEDGSDAPVENVAIILVKNPTGDFLEYARMVFDINGKEAVFVLRGLPPGASAWVMEANKLVIEPGSVFSLIDEIVSFGSAGIGTDGLKISVDTGIITVQNDTDTTLENVYVYYRQRHTDGNYLGGICYRVSFGTLEPGKPITATAGHFFPENSKIIKITCEKESS